MINKLGRSLESYWINLCESKKFSPNNEIPGKKSSIWEWTFYENPRSLFLYYSVGLKLNWFLRFWWQNNINTNWFSALKTLFKFWKSQNCLFKKSSPCDKWSWLFYWLHCSLSGINDSVMHDWKNADVWYCWYF